MNDSFLRFHLNILKKIFSNPEFELRALLNASSITKQQILLNNFDINKINYDKFKNFFHRRLLHEPISKISNNKEFWSLNFFVNQFVLDPRPESEFLIQTIRELFPDINKILKICDLGTGSGCLAVTIASIYKNSIIEATEISKEAIKVAKKNAYIHKVQNRIKFINCDWIKKNNKFDIVVSNPPYLSLNQYESCASNIKNFEPKIALLSGRDGLDSYRKIARISNSILHNASYLFLEIGQSQKDDIIKIFDKINLKTIKIIKDYQIIDRVLVLKKY